MYAVECWAPSAVFCRAVIDVSADSACSDRSANSSREFSPVFPDDGDLLPAEN